MPRLTVEDEVFTGPRLEPALAAIGPLIVPFTVALPDTVRLPDTEKPACAWSAYCACWARNANGEVRSCWRGAISVGEVMFAWLAFWRGVTPR